MANSKRLHEEKNVVESAGKGSKLKELLDDLNDFVKEDKEWLDADVVAFTLDGKKFKVDFVGQGDNGEIIVNLGKQMKLENEVDEAEQVDEWNDTHIPHGRVAHHDTGKPKKFWVAVDDNGDILTNYSQFVNQSLQLSDVGGNKNPPFTTIDPKKAKELAKRAIAKWPKKYVFVGVDDSSRGLMTGKNHLRASVRYIWYPDIKAWNDAAVDEAEEVNETALNLDDLEEVTVVDMLKLARKLYPHNSDGGKTSPIVGIVDGHLADFTAVAFAKHEGHPDPGTFFLHDGTKASLDALEEQLEVGQYDEAENVNEASAELEATAEKLKQYDRKYVKWEELTDIVADNGELERHIWLKSPNGVLVCRIDSDGEKATYFIVDKDSKKLVEVGHDGMKKMFIYKFSPNSPKEDIPSDMPDESKSEKELDAAIEEGLKEIYR